MEVGRRKRVASRELNQNIRVRVDLRTRLEADLDSEASSRISDLVL